MHFRDQTPVLGVTFGNSVAADLASRHCWLADVPKSALRAHRVCAHQVATRDGSPNFPEPVWTRTEHFLIHQLVPELCLFSTVRLSPQAQENCTRMLAPSVGCAQTVYDLLCSQVTT